MHEYVYVHISIYIYWCVVNEALLLNDFFAINQTSHHTKMSNLGDSNRNNNSIDFSNGDDIAGKVDAFWREEYNIPYLTEMLERRQTLLTSMRVDSWESRIKPLELIYNRIERKNASLVLEREHIQMMIEDTMSRQTELIENASLVHNNLKKRGDAALSKYYFIVSIFRYLPFHSPSSILCLLFLPTISPTIISMLKTCKTNSRIKLIRCRALTPHTYTEKYK